MPDRKIRELEEQVKSCVNAINRAQQSDSSRNPSDGPLGSLPEVLLNEPEIPPSMLSTSYHADTSSIELHPPSCWPPMEEYSTVPGLWQLQYADPDGSLPQSYEPQLLRPPAGSSRRLGIVEVSQLQVDNLFTVSAFHTK